MAQTEEAQSRWSGKPRGSRRTNRRPVQYGIPPFRKQDHPVNDDQLASAGFAEASDQIKTEWIKSVLLSNDQSADFTSVETMTGTIPPDQNFTFYFPSSNGCRSSADQFVKLPNLRGIHNNYILLCLTIFSSAAQSSARRKPRQHG